MSSLSEYASKEQIRKNLSNKLINSIKELDLSRVIVQKIRQGIDPATYLNVLIPKRYKPPVYIDLGNYLKNTPAGKSLNPEGQHELATNLERQSHLTNDQAKIHNESLETNGKPLDSNLDVNNPQSDIFKPEKPLEKPTDKLSEEPKSADNEIDKKNEAKEQAQKSENEPAEKLQAENEAQKEGQSPKQVDGVNKSQKGISDKTKQLADIGKQTAIQSALKATGGGGGAATTKVLSRYLLPYTVPILVIIGIIIFIIAVIMAIAIYFPAWFGGKKGTEPANPIENRGDIQVNLGLYNDKELKKALDEDIPGFIKQIEKIKKNAPEKNKTEILVLCDEIINLANELKGKAQSQDISAPLGNDEAAKLKGEKEALKVKIMDKYKQLNKLLIINGEVPCLDEPEASYCGQTSVAMMVCAFNPLCGIKKSSTAEDYKKILGITDFDNSLVSTLSNYLPKGYSVVQVNNRGGKNFSELLEQAKIGNPVLIGSRFPDDTTKNHYMVITGYAGEENNEPVYFVNNPNYKDCNKIKLPQSFFTNNPYAGWDYWYEYVSPPLKKQ